MLGKLGSMAKNWRQYLPKNASISAAMATKAARKYATWATIGAGVGAVRGLSDNIVGEDRVSVMGGMIQGAMYGAAFRGMRNAWKYGRGKGASLMAGARGRGRVGIAGKPWGTP